MTSSFLDRRRDELQGQAPTVPLEFPRLRERACELLPEGAYDYAAGAAGTETTKRTNRHAFERYAIVSRVLRDISERDLEIKLFGTALPAPLVLAPIGGLRLYHDEGELAVARAASELGVPFTVSTAASYSLEDVADAGGDSPQFFQLYWMRDWTIAENLVKRADAAGYDGIVLTLDFPISRWLPRTLRNPVTVRQTVPRAILESDPVVRERAQAADQAVGEYVEGNPDLRQDSSLTWDDLDVLREWTDLPVVLKGLVAPDDARRAAEWGADGIVVSNHGGRQIDGQVAPLEQLPEIVDAVGDDISVLLDSGVRSGADAFKALAIGADAVGLGRPFIYGLTVAGEQGVYETILNVLAELESVMGLSGCPSMDKIDREAVVLRD